VSPFARDLRADDNCSKPLLGRPPFGLREQACANAGATLAVGHDEAADLAPVGRLQMVRDRDVNPADDSIVTTRDEYRVPAASDRSLESRSHRRRIGRVAELAAQLGERRRIVGGRRTEHDCRVNCGRFISDRHYSSTSAILA
jgi:hypothetical protein